MSLRFMDSFDHYSTADLLGAGSGSKWSGGVNRTDLLFIGGTGRFNNGLRLAFHNPFNNSGQIFKTFDNQATWIIGFAWRFAGTYSTTTCFFQLRDNTSQQVELALTGANTLQVLRNGSAVTGGLSTNTVLPNTWYYIEYKVTISPSITANQWQVNVNGTNWINVATGQSSRATSNSFANQLFLGIPQGYGSHQNTNNSPAMDYDDLYVLDGNSTPNDFLGDCRVECRFPLAASATNTAWLASAGTPVSCVSDPTPNADTSFIYSSTINDISTFTVPPLSTTPLTIYGLQLTHSSRKTDTGTRQIADVIRSASTNYPGTPINLSSNYLYFSSIYPTDPATSTAWTATGANNLEIGVKQVT